MIYNSIDEIPEQGRSLIEDLISKGVIEINNNIIHLDKAVYEALIILAKLGVI